MRIECAACALLLLLPCGRMPRGYGALARAALAGTALPGAGVQFSSSSESVWAGSSTQKAALLPALAGDTPLWPTGDRGPTGDCADGLKATKPCDYFSFFGGIKGIVKPMCLLCFAMLCSALQCSELLCFEVAML